MRGKIMLAVGLAAGYVLGSRAGRRRYEQIKAAAQSVWETPRVQNTVDSAKDFAMSSLGDAGEKAIDEIKKLIAVAADSARRAGSNTNDSGSGKSERSARGSSSTASTSSSSSGTRTAKSATARPRVQTRKPSSGTAAK